MDNYTNIPLGNPPPNSNPPNSICSKCGAVLGDGQLFCTVCGTRKSENPPNRVCPNCGAQISQGTAFCASCGQRIEINEVSRNAAIEQFNNNLTASKNKKAILKKVFIFGGIAVAVIIAIILFIVLSGGDKKDYQDACAALDNGNYQTAYNAFIALEGYEDSEDKIDDCIYEWIDDILSNGTASQAETFKNTVRLSDDHYSTVYSKITNEISSHNDFDYWDDYWNDTDKATIIYHLLQTLPTTYQDVSNLTRLFKVLYNGDIHPVADYIRNNSTLLASVWYVGFIQDFVKQDEMIYAFLEGYWTTADGEYYLNFYEDEDGGTSSTHDLPWVEKPSGTMYYGIKSLIYAWEDADGNQLAKVYRFTINDYNTITVYCYKNGRTYKLYR